MIRTYDLVPPPQPGSHHLKDVSSITERLRGHEKRKEERRVIQMRNAREKVRAAKEAAAAEEAAVQVDAKQEDGAEGADAAGEKRKHPDGSADLEGEGVPAKKARTEEGSGADADADAAEEAANEAVEPEASAEEEAAEEETPSKTLYNEPEVNWDSMVLTKPSPEMRGHTSYLTFATFYPASIRAQIEAQDGNTTALPTRAASPTS